MYKILVCDQLSQTALDILKDAPDVKFNQAIGLSEPELLKIISEYNAIIVRSSTKISDKVVNKAENLKVIGRAGTGLDNIDQASAVKKGIKIINTPGSNAPAVAELTIGLMFSLARKICQANDSMKKGNWDKNEFIGIELSGKKLGIIGCGKIGKNVAYLGAALNMNLLIYNKSPVILESVKFEQVSLERLLKESDFVTIHLPKNDTTQELLSAKELMKMKAGAYLINAARGGIVVEKDLLQALNNGTIAGAALDVFENEPDYNRELVEHPKVIATPHMGAASRESQERVGVIIVDQILEYLRSKYIFL
jgi:D-3-phosphoglycerate dehydrogenase / 2-oxoglutarate reductase